MYTMLILNEAYYSIEFHKNVFIEKYNSRKSTINAYFNNFDWDFLKNLTWYANFMVKFVTNVKNLSEMT